MPHPRISAVQSRTPLPGSGTDEAFPIVADPFWKVVLAVMSFSDESSRISLARDSALVPGARAMN